MSKQLREKLQDILGDLFVATHGGKTATDLGRDNIDAMDYAEAESQILALFDSQLKAGKRELLEELIEDSESIYVGTGYVDFVPLSIIKEKKKKL